MAVTDPVVPSSKAETLVVVTANNQTAFNFDFLIHRPTQLRVFHRKTDGSEVELSYPSQFSVTGIDVTSGGGINLIGVPVLVNDTIYIVRDTLIEREKKWQNEGDYKADLVNAEQNDIYMIMQELARSSGKSFDEIKALWLALSDEEIERKEGYDYLLSLIGDGSRSMDAPIFDSVDAAQHFNIKSHIKCIIVLGFASPGDGGFSRYIRVAFEPSHKGKFKSADGSWWEIVGTEISVKAFGAKGNGASPDQPLCQNAVDYIAYRGGGKVIFPAGEYLFTATLQLPIVDMELLGCKGSVIKGSVNLITYPTTCFDGNGVVRLQDISGFTFKQTGGNHCIVMHQTWTASGKLGHDISGNTFEFTSGGFATPRAISLRGVWSASIHHNRFIGKGSNLPDNFSGFGIYFDIGAAFDTSIMNVLIYDNSFVLVSHPVYMLDQAVNASSAGRIEGITIRGNSMVNGNVGVTVQGWATSTLISENMISDYYVCVDLPAAAYVSIINNVEISAWKAPIRIGSKNAWYIHEGFVILGNCIKTREKTTIPAGADAGILITNSTDIGRIRDVLISGNLIYGGLNTTTESGILIDGVFSTDNVSIVDNMFTHLEFGISFTNATHRSIVLSGNNYRAISGSMVQGGDTNATFLNAGSKTHAATVVVMMTGTSYTLTVPVAANTFVSKPISAACSLSGEHSDRMICQYNHSTSTATSLKFTVTMADGSALPATGRRFTIQACGNGG